MSKARCKRCGKPATHRVVFVTRGVREEFYLCDACFEQYLKSRQFQESEKFISGMISDVIHELAQTTPNEEISPCPSCGMEYEDVLKHHSVGCPDCYAHFREQINLLLQKLVPLPRHTGSSPGSKSILSSSQGHLEELLKEAIKQENFEYAAMIRDILNKVAK